MQLLSVITYLFVFSVIEFLYFKIADHFNIIDKPNHRSSHSQLTIRGGGIIFPIAAFIWFLFNKEYPYFIFALLAISVISFLDDILTLNNKLRLLIHLTAVLLLFQQWNLFNNSWYLLFPALIFAIATINAYNFMDGINGLTGIYSLLTIVTFYYINSQVIEFIDSSFLIIIGLSLFVFNFFNFRKKAKCFAGDVGSVSMAFIIIFLTGKLILKTENLNYVMLLLIYGLDTATTVFFRLIRKENIFEAHRTHFYQYLVNQLKFSHIKVSIIYLILQLTINIILILYIKTFILAACLVFIISLILFLSIRFIVEGKSYLLKGYLSNNLN